MPGDENNREFVQSKLEVAGEAVGVLLCIIAGISVMEALNTGKSTLVTLLGM